MASTAVTFARRSWQRQYSASLGGRMYSSTRPFLDDEAAPAKVEIDKKELQQIAVEFGRRRASYNRQVSNLRRSYMEEYQRHKQEDEAQRQAEQEETTRRRLERQRAKNERSVQNMLRQEELRRQTQLAFEDHLRVEQEKRDAKKSLYTKSQQLLINELEEEAHLWLTTPEEVEAAFTPEAEQLLWARPQGVLGVPNPSLDSHFWQYETHTWDMSKTYKTHQDILLEENEEAVYNSTNVDDKFWTPERIAAREELEIKAKLRANVRLEGRRSLLKRQQQYMDEASETTEGETPKSQPTPSLGVLANVRAQENEGSQVLFKDPTQFFEFDRSGTDSLSASPSSDSSSYSGPALGAPIALRDPLRSNAPQGRVFPQPVGKMPKPDMRTEKEKKRQEREEKLWAAAQANARSEMDEIDMAADEDAETGEPLDYDSNLDWDSDDEEWAKGLDPELQKDIINMPREIRYREEDIDWVIQKLEAKAKGMESHVRNAVSSMEQELRSRKERRGSIDDKEETAEDGAILDDSTRGMLVRAGADPDKYERILQSLSEDQLLSLFALEAEQSAGSEEKEALFNRIPDLSEEQRIGLVEMDNILYRVENKI